MKCEARTRLGKRCSRNAQENSRYCYQHEKIFGSQGNPKKRLRHNIKPIFSWVDSAGSIASIVALLIVFLPLQRDPNSQEPSFVHYIASWLGICFGIFWLSEKVEDTVVKDTRKAVSLWILGLEMPQSLPNWSSTFAKVFDRIFGEKHLSWKCFLRSCIASHLSVIILFLLYFGIVVRPLALKGQIRLNLAYFVDDNLLLLYMIPLNVVFDYFSLLESRFVIRWIARSSSNIRAFIFLVIDLIVTGFIALLAIWVGLTFLIPLFFSIDMEFYLSIGYVWRTFWAGLRFTNAANTIFPISSFWGVYIHSTLFTSMWVWLYVLSGLIVRLVRPAFGGINWFKRVFDIENKPLRSLGYVSVLFVTLIYFIAPFLSKFV